MRCFVGIELDLNVARSAQAAIEILRSADRRWAQEKWVAPENLHVTTCFIGEVDTSRIEELSSALIRAAAPCEPFGLTPRCVIARPRATSARMLWASMDDETGGAARLARAVTQSALTFGASSSPDTYSAHVTLCRARHSRAISSEALQAASSQLTAVPESMSVSSATLFSSRLTPHGPIYERLTVLHLRGE